MKLKIRISNSKMVIKIRLFYIVFVFFILLTPFSIFEAADPNFKWDGKHKGQIMNTQVLAYYLRVEFIDQTLLEKKGNISLIK